METLGFDPENARLKLFPVLIHRISQEDYIAYRVGGSKITTVATSRLGIQVIRMLKKGKTIDGWKRADIEALSKVYAADARVTGIWPDPTLKYPVQGWPEVRRELERVFDFGRGMNMFYSPRHVEIYGDIAIISTNWEWVDGGPAAPGTPEVKLAEQRRLEMKEAGFGGGQVTFVFQHRGNHWVLVHEHASVLPADK